VGIQNRSRRIGQAIVLSCLALLALASGASAYGPSAVSSPSAQTAAKKPAMLRVVLLGLRGRGNPTAFASQVSEPGSPIYRRFLTQSQFRQRFSASAADQRRVSRYLRSRRGVRRVELNPSRTVALVTLNQSAGSRLFCAKGMAPPAGGLCVPRPLRAAVRQITAGETYTAKRARSKRRVEVKSGTPRGCAAALKTGAFTPNQMATAYGVDALHDQGLTGSGIRVVTLSSQMVPPSSFRTWAKCFDLPVPKVTQFAMPSAQAGTAPDETVLDVEALATLAPGLERITPIFVPLDQSFSHSFSLFMFGALDPKRQGGKLPDILSISDGVCEERFNAGQLRLGQRLLTEAAALGITALAASGDLGFQGCFTNARGAMFPSSSPFTTSVGGTDLTLTAANEIAAQPVWSTYATAKNGQGVGTGGGPSARWPRPSFQTGPGIGPALQKGKPTRLSPDIAAMASFTPGLATFDQGESGWGVGGGTSAATPLAAAIVALTEQRETAAGRPPLGSLPPLLYELARGPGYASIFNDVTVGTSSRNPKSAAGRSPAGGAARPGFDLATGLGSLRAAAFAGAVATVPPANP